jgi:hypothetical protein
MTSWPDTYWPRSIAPGQRRHLSWQLIADDPKLIGQTKQPRSIEPLPHRGDRRLLAGSDWLTKREELSRQELTLLLRLLRLLLPLLNWLQPKQRAGHYRLVLSKAQQGAQKDRWATVAAQQAELTGKQNSAGCRAKHLKLALAWRPWLIQ